MRRPSATGVLAAAALVPPVVWLLPALLRRQAPTFRDQGDFFFPLKLYTADRLRGGAIPFWNPWSGLGEPWLANAQSGPLYPPTLFFLLSSPALAAALFLLAHFALGAWGTWRFCKEEGVGDAGALAAAAVFAGSGLTASFSAYWNHFGALAYLPAIALAARSGLRTRRAAAGLGLALGLQAMAGSPEMTALSLLVALALVFPGRPEAASGWRSATGGRRFRRFALAAALGFGLAGWALVPMAELVVHSDRSHPLPASEREAGAVRGDALASTVVAGESSNFFLGSFYLGPVAIALAAAAFLDRPRRALAGTLAAIAAAGVLLAAAGPPGAWLRALPGLDRMRYPAKALAPALFAFSVLAGLGVDALRFAPGRRLRVAAAAAAAGALLAAALAAPPGPLAVVPAVGLAAVALLALVPRGGAAGAALGAAAALSLPAGFLFANAPLYRFAPESELRRRPDDVAFLARIPGRTLTPPMEALVPWVIRDGRYDAATLRRQRESLIGYTNLLAQVRTVRTAAALPTEAARRVADGVDADADPARGAGPAGGRVFWTPFLPGNLGSRKVGDFFRATLNPYRLRVSYATAYRVEPDAARAWDLVASGRSDWSRVVLLDEAPRPAPAGGAGKYVLARIAEDAPERVVADVTADAPGILVLADLAYPGWRARVDGKPSPLLRADGYLRAVALPAGAHRVEFRYRPVSFAAGAVLTLAALAILLRWLFIAEPARRPV